MTPEELRDLVAETRGHADDNRASVARLLESAARHEMAAGANRRQAAAFEALAVTWDQTAAALECGAIVRDDGALLTDLRTALAEARAALDPLATTPPAVAFGAATSQPGTEDDAFADGYVAALDDARVASGRETLLECPTHGAAYYAGRECPACAMDAAVAAWAAEDGGHQ